MAPTKQEMLEVLETAINTKMAGGMVRSYSIGGRNIQYEPLNELFKMRTQLQNEISAGRNRTTYVKFENPK